MAGALEDRPVAVGAAPREEHADRERPHAVAQQEVGDPGVHLGDPVEHQAQVLHQALVAVPFGDEPEAVRGGTPVAQAVVPDDGDSAAVHVPGELGVQHDVLDHAVRHLEHGHRVVHCPFDAVEAGAPLRGGDAELAEPCAHALECDMSQSPMSL